MNQSLRSALWGGSFGRDLAVCYATALNGLGQTSYQTWAFRRAELTAAAPTPFRCHNGAPAIMAPLRSLPPTAMGVERMTSMTYRALGPHLQMLSGLPKGSRLAFVLCLPERMHDGARAFVQQRRQLESEFYQNVQLAVPDCAPEIICRGHAGFGYGLLRAAEELNAGRVHAILIGGVDTYYDPLVVEELLAEERIFDGENTDCFLGGEGAAFALLAPKSLARQMGWKTLAWLEGAATNGEPGNASNDVPCMGLGLSRVARACTERLVAEGRKVDWWISDLTPEESRGHELQLAWPRAAYEVMDEHSFLDVLPEHVGDLGAATMPTALAIAAEGLRRGDPAGDTCLFTASSNNEDRAAVLVAGQGTR